MRARTAQVLQGAVREFIRSGAPVSSLALAKRGLFGVSPATIRAELGILAEEGYLAQLHTSGGRVPTDKGYELYVEGILKTFPESRVELDEARAEEFFEGAYRDFVRNASRRLRLMSAGYDPESGDFCQSGLDDLFERLDAADHREFAEVARDIERLDERCAELASRAKLGDVPRVFIGKRSPLTESEHLAVIMDEYRGEDGERFFFMALGPKRMNYERNLSIFKLLYDSICNG